MKSVTFNATSEELDLLMDILSTCDDCGPHGSGWQSEELEVVIAKLRGAVDSAPDNANMDKS